MSNPKLSRLGPLICLVGLLTTARPALAASALLYQVVEQTMTNTTSFANPFTDTELRLAVVAPSGRPLGASFTWYGFFGSFGTCPLGRGALAA